MLDEAALDVVLKLEPANAIECAANGCDLFNNLNAIRVVFDHLHDSVEMTTNGFKPVEDVLFALVAKAAFPNYHNNITLPHPGWGVNCAGHANRAVVYGDRLA